MLIWERLDEDYDDDEDDDDTEEDDSDEDDMEDDEEEGDEDDDEGVGKQRWIKAKRKTQAPVRRIKVMKIVLQGILIKKTDPPDGKSSDAKSQRNQTKCTDHGGFKEGLPYGP